MLKDGRMNENEINELNKDQRVHKGDDASSAMVFEEGVWKLVFYKLLFQVKNVVCTLNRKRQPGIVYGSFHYSFDYGLKY